MSIQSTGGTVGGFVQNLKRSVGENEGENAISNEKVVAVKLLETSRLVDRAATKNFVARADQITVTRRKFEGDDVVITKRRRTDAEGGVDTKLTFTGAPIEQLIQETWKDPTPLFPLLFMGSHAEAVLLTHQASDGSVVVTGESLCYAMRFVEDAQFFGSCGAEQHDNH